MLSDNEVQIPDKGYKSAQKQHIGQWFTPEVQVQIPSSPQKPKEKEVKGLQLQFQLLSEEELGKLKTQKIEEINLKYKQIISSIKEKYTNVIESRRGRIRDYILKTKQYFKNYIDSLRNRMKLEVSFLNQKSKEINYYNIMYVIKLWVFSIIGEIRK